MEFFGNIFTHYNYTTTDIRQTQHDHETEVCSTRSDFRIAIKSGELEISLPEHSPFADWKEARRFAGPMPFTFTYNPETRKVLIIEGVRENWTPKPVQVTDYHISFLNTLPLKSPVLANAFMIEKVPYYWKKGRIGAMERVRRAFPGSLEHCSLQLAFLPLLARTFADLVPAQPRHERAVPLLRRPLRPCC